jgi:hypothetical protein
LHDGIAGSPRLEAIFYAHGHGIRGTAHMNAKL